MSEFNINPIYHRQARGKLLITSEYFVLDGASALAIPTLLGQTLTVSKSKNFGWEAYFEDNTLWFNNEDEKKDEVLFLNKIFQEIKLLNPDSFSEFNSNFFKTHLEFKSAWGLGSSSTFIALLSDYFSVNPYILNHKIFKGSGYDIACAFATNAILYQNTIPEQPNISEINISENIKPYLYFVYTGKKQNSRDAISHYFSLTAEKIIIGHELSQLTRDLITKDYYKDWHYLLNTHEEIISKVLKLPLISKTLFKELPYFSKSLGAWGGDFALIISDEGSEMTKKTIQNNGFDIVLNYKEIFG